MAKSNIVKAVNRALQEEMAREDSVVVLGEDVGVNGGVFRATEGLYDEFGSERVIDTPLAELGIVGTAIGMAVMGLRPVAEIQFMGFTPPTWDQLVSHASRIRNRSRGRFHVPLVVRAPYGGGIHALEHHSESTESILLQMPGLKVAVPSTPYDAIGLLKSAIREPDPVFFMEPKRIYRAVVQDVPEDEFTVSLGEARIARSGRDVTVVCWGSMVRPALKAAEALEDVSAEVVDLRTLDPLDVDAVLDSVKKTGRLLVVHEAPRNVGFGAEIAALVAEKAVLFLEAPVVRVTGFDTPFPYSKLEGHYLPDEGRISDGIRRAVEF